MVEDYAAEIKRLLITYVSVAEVVEDYILETKVHLSLSGYEVKSMKSQYGEEVKVEVHRKYSESLKKLIQSCSR